MGIANILAVDDLEVANIEGKQIDWITLSKNVLLR